MNGDAPSDPFKENYVMKLATAIRTCLFALPLAALPFAAQADTPNIQPGEWEYTHTTVMDGPHDMPEQVETHTECVTAEDLERGEDLIEAPEDCTLESVSMDADGMEYTMTCAGPDGSSARMEASMQFYGDRTEGEMHTQIDTPMGPMDVEVKVEGQRIGDC